MKNIIIKLIKKLVFAFGIIYGINLIFNGNKIFIPINIITLSMTAFLGIPGFLTVFIIIFFLK